MDILEKKQEDEFQKDLSGLQKEVALDKLIAEEKVKNKFKDLKDEAAADLSGEELKSRLNELETEKKQELREVKKDIDAKAKVDE